MGLTRSRRRRRATPPPGNGNGNGHDTEPEQLSLYAQARGEREQYAAKLVQLEYEAASGKLVNAELVKQEAYEAARRARDILLALPARAAPVVAALAEEAACYDALEELVREVCQEIAKTVEKPPAKRTKGKRGKR